ncbi:MAG: phosphoribosylamine--glycine ligase [Vicinamibacterales bacterium]
MKVLVVGGGGREHAFAWKLAGERGVSKVVCAPGNPGVAAIARCLPIDAGDPAAIVALASRERIDLTVVGPELPLSRGVVDTFETAGRAIVGPSKTAAALESSKAFAKAFMARHDVPTARFHICASADGAFAALAHGDLGYPVVIKADGLAAGKGVVIADDREAAGAAVRAAMVDRRFGAAGERLVIEELMIGEEASYFVLTDGTSAMPLASAQDHKRIFDGDRGPNTGGMGAFAPSPLVTPAIERRINDEIVGPVLAGMATEGRPFRGFLYVGLMLTTAGPRVVEFNVRFGDPEAQVVVPMLDEDLSTLLWAAASGALPGRSARFRAEPHVGVVLASAGYPESSDSGRVIEGLDAAARVPGALVFHAGTAERNGRTVTAGGRVLTVVGRGRTYRDAVGVAYRAAEEVRFEGMQFRRDIGARALQYS